jgi:hypothetical protein
MRSLPMVEVDKLGKENWKLIGKLNFYFYGPCSPSFEIPIMTGTTQLKCKIDILSVLSWFLLHNFFSLKKVD